MSKALFEKLSKLHAGISDVYEELAAKASGKAAAADDADEPEEEELPKAKAAGTKGKPAAKTAAKGKPKAAAVEPDEEEAEEAEETEEEAEDDGPSEDDVVAAAQALIKAFAGNKDKAIAIIKKHGGKKVADLDSDTYPAVIADFKKAMPKKGAKPAADDTDDI